MSKQWVLQLAKRYGIQVERKGPSRPSETGSP
jgi:hypothetical protein